MAATDDKNIALCKLYKNLRERAEDKKYITPINVDNLCSSLRRLSPDHAAIIQLLIIHHHETENVTTWSKVPYNGVLGSDGVGVSYYLKDIPILLQKMFTIYLQLSAAGGTALTSIMS
jgi:hypothetical protein